MRGVICKEGGGEREQCGSHRCKKYDITQKGQKSIRVAEFAKYVHNIRVLFSYSYQYNPRLPLSHTRVPRPSSLPSPPLLSLLLFPTSPPPRFPSSSPFHLLLVPSAAFVLPVQPKRHTRHLRLAHRALVCCRKDPLRTIQTHTVVSAGDHRAHMAVVFAVNSIEAHRTLPLPAPTTPAGGSG